jgi:hypothetical protein
VGRKKPSKYHNEKITFCGITFDSKKEFSRWTELKLLEQAKVIQDLEYQVRIKLTCGGEPVRSKKGRQLAYVVDFKYWDNERQCRRYEDVKGYDTPLSALKVAIVEAESGIVVEIVR